MKWQFINTGLADGEFNMKYDIELAEKLLRREILPTVRVYGWKPWTVSLGYNQSEEDIDSTKCYEYGVGVVRRPTGGRAILHANEVTYSVVMFADGKGITEIYSLISRALVAGLSAVCSKVSYETSQPNFRQLYRKQESIPCFSSSARYEVQIDNKKLVGSAQRRFSHPEGSDVVLQHGSILLGPEHMLLSELLRLDDEAVRKAIRTDFEQKTIDLSTATGKVMTFDEVAVAIKEGFEKTLNIHFVSTSESIYEHTNVGV